VKCELRATLSYHIFFAIIMKKKKNVVDLNSILRRLREIRKETNTILKRSVSDMDLIRFQYISGVQIATKTKNMCLKSIISGEAIYEQSDLDRLRDALQFFTSASKYRDVVSNLKRLFASGMMKPMNSCHTNIKNGFSWQDQRNEHDAAYIITRLVRRRGQERKRKAVVSIQSRYRSYAARLVYKIELVQKSRAVRKIQREYRRLRESRRDDAARMIQRHLRNFVFRQQRQKHARRIQTTWRGMFERRTFQNCRKACVKVQTWIRRSHEQRRLNSVRKIQRVMRSFLRRRAQFRAERTRRRHARRKIGQWLLLHLQQRIRIRKRALKTLSHFFKRYYNSRTSVSQNTSTMKEDPAIDDQDEVEIQRKRKHKKKKKKKKRKSKEKRQSSYELPPLVSEQRRIQKQEKVVVVISRPPLGKLRVPPGRMRTSGYAYAN
jgi:hypothetical protein